MKSEIGPKIIESLAPARTCLFGDHQDYLGLPIIACAINRYINLKASTNSMFVFNVNMPDVNEKITIGLNELYDDVKGDSLRASLKVLKKYDCLPFVGYDVEISGNIAINAGTSSSSALIIAWVKFLLEAYGCNQIITPELVSQIAYEAEVVEQGSSGGKMDQYSIGLGKIIYLETGDNLVYKTFKRNIPGLIIGESGIPKDTLGVLKELKENTCLSIIKVKEKMIEFDLARAQMEDLSSLLNYLPEKLKPYFFAAVSNHCITQEALVEFEKDNLDLKKIGTLMNSHHAILKNVLKITVPKIDAMIDAALQAGAYGAKIVGSGRGGSIVVIAPEDKELEVVQAIINAGGENAYTVKVDEGARILES